MIQNCTDFWKNSPPPTKIIAYLFLVLNFIFGGNASRRLETRTTFIFLQEQFLTCAGYKTLKGAFMPEQSLCKMSGLGPIQLRPLVNSCLFDNFLQFYSYTYL
jgi:hypothetical protein